MRPINRLGYLADMRAKEFSACLLWLQSSAGEAQQLCDFLRAMREKEFKHSSTARRSSTHLPLLFIDGTLTIIVLPMDMVLLIDCCSQEYIGPLCVSRWLRTYEVLAATTGWWYFQDDCTYGGCGTFNWFLFPIPHWSAWSSQRVGNIWSAHSCDYPAAFTVSCLAAALDLSTAEKPFVMVKPNVLWFFIYLVELELFYKHLFSKLFNVLNIEYLLTKIYEYDDDDDDFSASIFCTDKWGEV